MIRNLEAKIFNSFRGGRYTRNNLVDISDDHVLVANQIIFPGDGVAHKRPGYTLVATPGFAATQIFDFQRQSDGQQFIILAGGGKIGWIRAGGGAVTLLASVEDPTAVWSFASNTFGLYGSNGIHHYRFVDVAGVLTRFAWGIQAPGTTPTLTTGAGALTLTYGRQYAFSFVSKWTDSLGTQRIHVGPPSPLSLSSGPQTAKVINVNNLQTSVDTQVTHLWIWATNDTPTNTTSVLYFLGEVTNGTATFGDTLPDTSLDTTRQIPYDNFAPPLASIITEYQGRFALAGIPGKPDLVQGTGLEEIQLGIPQETAPRSVFFSVPGGIKKISAAKEFNQSLMLSTQAYWFMVTGFSADTFQENDNIFSPGAAGKDLVCVTPTWLAWVGVDKKLWAWNGYGEPLEVSWKIARADGTQQLSMESMRDDLLANGQLRWYSFGRYNFIALFVSTQNNAYFDWCQLWDVSVLTSPAGPMGALTKDGMLLGAAESDAFFLDHIIGVGPVQVNSTPYLFMCDVAGNVFRFPDGFTDHGNEYAPVVGSEFSDCDKPEMLKRFRWMDVRTSRDDAAAAFGAAAIVSDGVKLDGKPPHALEIIPVPAAHGVDPSMFRAKLEAAGTAVGKFIRWFVEWPIDDQDAEVYSASVASSIVGKDQR